MHVTYVPFIKAAGELKTKPTQQSVAKLREIGIMPHVLVCRCERRSTRNCARKFPCSATCRSKPSSRKRTWTIPFTKCR